MKKLIKTPSNVQYSSIERSLSSLFDQNPSYFLSLLSNKNVRKDLGIHEDEIIATLITEIQPYKHFLHPYRLSIMQLLFDNDKVASVEIRNKLNLSWSDFYNTVKALEKLEAIRVIEDFDLDGSKRQFIVMNEQAKIDYVRLIKLIDNFVDQAKGRIPGYSKDFLYPES